MKHENKSILDGISIKEIGFSEDKRDVLQMRSKPGQIIRMSENGQAEWVDPPPGFWNHLKK